MFFTPADYLTADPDAADSEREAERLRREAQQRAKLCEATTRLMAAGGLDAAVIHATARAAGVGQGTYYRLFETRDDCLREAFERCAEVVIARVAEVAAEQEEPQRCLEAGLGELLDLLGADPDVGRLLLVGILAGDDPCRAARERALDRLADLLATGPAGEGGARRGGPAWLSAAAIASSLTTWIERDGEASEVQLLDELVRVASWARSTARIEPREECEESREELDRDTPSARRRKRRRARDEQRQRTLVAMAELAARQGAAKVTLSDLLRRAKVSRPLFYSIFENKEQCLLEAFDAELDRVLEAVRAALKGTTTCVERATAGMRALVECLRDQPAGTRLILVEIRAAGARGEERYEVGLRKLAGLIGEARGVDGGDLPDADYMVATTLAGMIASELRGNQTGGLERLLPKLVFAALAPYVGGEEAARVAGRRRAA